VPADAHRPFSRRLNVYSLLTELMQSLLILATVAIPVVYFAPEQALVLFGLTVFALAATAWIRAACRHIWQFVLLGLVIVALPLVLPILPPFSVTIWPRLISVPVLLFLAVRAFYLRLKQKEEKPLGSLAQQALVILYLLALNLVALRLDLTVVSQAYFYVGVVYLMLALLRWHHLSLNSQLERFMTMPTQPAARIMHFNNILLLGYALVTLVLLVISPLFRLHDLLPWLGSLLLAVIRWLLQKLQSGEPEPTEPVPEPTQPPGGQDPHLPFEPSETARWLVILQEIFYYLMIAVSVAIVLFLIFLMLRALYKRFYETAQPDSDKTESLLPSFLDQTRERIRKVQSRFSIQFGQTPSQQVRRSFYRLITAQLRHGLTIEASQTPRQLVARFDVEQYPDLLSLATLYEAARYGPEISTPEDAEQAQRMVRSLRRQNLLRPTSKPEQTKANKKRNAR
jgi:hypothetical protein